MRPRIQPPTSNKDARGCENEMCPYHYIMLHLISSCLYVDMKVYVDVKGFCEYNAKGICSNLLQLHDNLFLKFPYKCYLPDHPPKITGIWTAQRWAILLAFFEDRRLPCFCLNIGNSRYMRQASIILGGLLSHYTRPWSKSTRKREFALRKAV